MCLEGEKTCGCSEELLKLRVVIEVLRYGSACCLAKALADLSARELPHGREDSKGLMTAVIFEGIKSAAAMQNASVDQSRRWVHPVLDVHRQAKVCEKKATAGLQSLSYTLKDIALTADGVLGVLHSDDDDVTTRNVPLNDLQLSEDACFFYDELLPVVEGIQPQQASKSALNWFLEKLCGASTKLLTSFRQKRRRAWELTDRVTILFYDERKKLAALKERAKQEEGDIHLDSVKLLTKPCDDGDDDAMLLVLTIRDQTADGWFSACCPREMVPAGSRDVSVRLQIRAEHVRRLRQLAACSVNTHFCLSLALVLLRYSGLSGGALQLEPGWHAGLPASVFRVLVDVFQVTAECFASPLNCTLPMYFSAFPDTDGFFGCRGNFFSSQLLPPGEKGPLSLEANPPFDHEVIGAALSRALQCLENTPSAVPVLFVFVLPESTQSNGIAVRSEAEKSRFFRASCVLSPQCSRYVDGARHVGRPGKRRRESCVSPREGGELVMLLCSTRLLVLQNNAAAAMFPAEAGLAKVRHAWEAL